jgi:hypothetical protein
MTRAELDPKLKQAISIGTPVEIIDPTTNQLYYLISAEQFSIIARAFSDDLDPREAYPFVESVMVDDDAHDPLLDSYQ